MFVLDLLVLALCWVELRCLLFTTLVVLGLWFRLCVAWVCFALVCRLVLSVFCAYWLGGG